MNAVVLYERDAVRKVWLDAPILEHSERYLQTKVVYEVPETRHYDFTLIRVYGEGWTAQHDVSGSAGFRPAGLDLVYNLILDREGRTP